MGYFDWFASPLFPVLVAVTGVRIIFFMVLFFFYLMIEAELLHLRFLCILGSELCTFDFDTSNLYKRCSNLAGWILRTFTIRDPQVMLTLYKSLVMSRLEYASQLWSPYLLKHVNLIEEVQRAFTKHISGMLFLFYSKRLEVLKLYSLKRRRERYGIIHVWKIIEGLVPNLPCSFSDRRGRACVVCRSGAGRLGTLKYNSFRWRSIRMFNKLPKAIHMLSSYSVVGFKSKFDLHGGHYADDLAAN